MLVDSAHIQMDDAAFVSKQRAKKKLPPVEPLYTIADAEKTLHQFVAVSYERPFLVVDGVTVTFRDAGHILGSAQVILDVREGNRKFRYLFSGDVGRGSDEILRDPQPTENVDYLQIESTYGGREHAVRTDADETVGRLVLETLESKRQGHHPGVFGRAHAADCLCAEPAHARGQIAARADFCGQPVERERHGDLPPAPGMFQRHASTNSCTKRRIPFGMENLTYIREVAQFDEAERFEGTRHHHQRVGHVRSRAHPASSQKPHRRSEESDSVHRLSARNTRWARKSRRDKIR